MRRRAFLAALGGALAVNAAPQPVRLHVGNYGMQLLTVDKALEAIRKIGYDGAELCLMTGWPSEPAKLDAAARRRIREQPLPIPTLIENFTLLGDEAAHRNILDRIARAAELGHEIAPKQVPLLQSVVGGKPGEWEQVKDRMVTRLAAWGEEAAHRGIRVAVKAHISSACDTPDKLIWLLDQVRQPSITGIYDYGHFELLNLPLEGTLRQLLPRSAFLTIKDGRLVNGKPQFLLPGDGTIDYKQYFQLLSQLKYRGWMLVEISRQLQTQPGYDPFEAAAKSYRSIAPLLAQAKLRRV